tara:strand:- start:6411 stop:8933 length:2523 start_codon:yes stop_codon:yes gene_type:complete
MSFQEFLNKHKLYKDSSEKPTHYSLPPEPAKYRIVGEHVEEFFELYSEEVKVGKQPSIVEVHEDLSPIVIDIDLRYNIDDCITRAYEESDVMTFVKLFNNEIVKYFDCSNDDMTAYVFEKPNPTKVNGNIKDGIHIIYPHIISKADIQYEIRENIIEQANELRLKEKMNCKNHMEDIIDKAVIEKNGWMLLGSGKFNSDAYKLTKIFDFELNSQEIPELDAKYFSIREHEEATHVKRQPKTGPKISKSYNSTPAAVGDIATAIKLTDILSLERCDSYADWLSVGFCLHNIDVSLLSSWIKFSRKSEKFREGECERLWNGFKKGDLGIGSLYRWAKLDDPGAYMQIKKNEVQTVLLESLSGTNYDVANVLFTMYKYQYVCASVKFSTWFEFHNHKWIEMDKALSLRKKLSTELAKEYRMLSNYYRMKSLEAEPDKVEECQKKHKRCEKLLENVKTTAFKDKVMIECAELFYNSKFLKKLDSHHQLLGFENGVYDLNRLCFRDGRPDDYVSLSTGIDYVEPEESDDAIYGLKDFLKKVQPSEEERKFVLRLFASFLHGKTTDQKFHIWTGSGGNGKSKIIELFESCLGDYCTKLPITVLTQKRAGSSAANPEIAKTMGKRFASLQEPEEGDKINVGYMKELTGGDIIQARGLFKEPVEFKPQFKLILTCNTLPTIPSNDGGTWRRLRVLDFPSKFVDDPTEPNEYKKDNDLDDKMKTWKEVFMYTLIQTYPKYKSQGLQEPPSIQRFTKEYQKRSDLLLDYLNDAVDFTNDKNDVMELIPLHEKFKVWYESGYGAKPPSRKIFKDYIDRINSLGPSKNMKYRGIKYKKVVSQNSDEDSDEDL